MSGLPWFKVYAAETLSDSRFLAWDMEERGAWFTLLLVCWREGSIPSDQESLAKLLHTDASAMRRLWSGIGSRFVEHLDEPGRLTSPRLEMEREQAEKLSAKRSEIGKAGARSRWDKRNRKHGKRMPLPSVGDGKSIANHSDQIRSEERSDQTRSEQNRGGSEFDPVEWKRRRERQLEEQYGVRP